MGSPRASSLGWRGARLERPRLRPDPWGRAARGRCGRDIRGPAAGARAAPTWRAPTSRSSARRSTTASSYRSGTRFGPARDPPGRRRRAPGPAAHEARRRPVRGAARRRLRRRRGRARRPRALARRLRRAWARSSTRGRAVVLGGDHSLSCRRCRCSRSATGRTATACVHLDTHADTGADSTATRTTTARPSTWRSRRAHARREHRAARACAVPGRSPTSSSGCATRASAGTRWTRSTSAAWPRCWRTRSPHAPAPRPRDLPDRRHRRARPGLRARAPARPSPAA